MSVIKDVLKSYRSPRSVFQHRMKQGVREDRSLAILMAACVLVFVSQWPMQARIAHETGQELNMLLGSVLLAWVFIMPLVLYAIGSISHGVARLFKARGTAFGARFALFWSLLCATPLWLLWGLVGGFIGPGIQMQLSGIIAFLTFLIFWSVNFRQAEWPKE
ncbi:YIP1 family protein [Aliiroseovarius crassostreae]|uniref:YIP1 family protein n=1 Tax=Aliiroseovarius crassostreae TaxID=154981 RepID=UPI0021FFB130|nr:YIP1 family protein [Aliiroseovarius crassostreae]UWQ05985.1 YIP1 family protein [Aliiroseovarius crassostreae]